MQFEDEKTRTIRMLEHLATYGNFTLTDEIRTQIRNGEKTENQYVVDFSTHAHSTEPFNDALMTIYHDIDINLASGEALDRLGRLWNIARFTAQPGFVDVTFEVNLYNPEDITIPAGTPVYCDGLDGRYGSYVTSETVVLNAGSMSGSVRCECTEYGTTAPLPEGSVTRIGDFGFSSVTNPLAGTGGRNIEEDDEYRNRIRNNMSVNTLGNRGFLENYLGHYSGLDSYALVPCYDGVGTLKIVCDTLESNLEQISADVYRDCIIDTDYPPLCVLPSEHSLQELTVYVTRGDGETRYTDDELIQLVESQIRTFLEGGLNRAGLHRSGYPIGRDFYPSELLSYLVQSFPECANIRLRENEVVPVDVVERIGVESVEVVIE